MTRKENLKLAFEEAIKTEKKFFIVVVQMEGFPSNEIIINTTENFEAKLKYYKNVYNDNLELKVFNGIKIVEYFHSNDFDSIEVVLGLK